MIICLMSSTGCDTRFGDVFFQSASAGGRTIFDLVLTNFANVIAAVLGGLRG